MSRPGWLPDVQAALQKLNEWEERVQGYARNEEAEAGIQGALDRVNEQASVRAAERGLGAIQRHIDEDHWPDDDPSAPAAATDPKVAAMREAYRMSLLFSRPRALEEDVDRPGWYPGRSSSAVP